MHIFIGTSTPEHAPAERVLEHTIRRFQPDATITWMDHARPHPIGQWVDWKIGRERHETGKIRPPRSWYTNFTCFRFAIPELMNFTGEALYLDVDMACLRDPALILEMRREKGIPVFGASSDVLAFDCSKFAGQKWWPSVAQMRKSGWRMHQYIALLQEHSFYVPRKRGAPGCFESCDGEHYKPGETIIFHWTHVETQPWKPYPDTYNHPEEHPNQVAREMWERLNSEATS